MGDVRCNGLLMGVELVTDRHSKTPDPLGAKYAMSRMKELGVLVSTDGPFRNVLKMKPPICFNSADALMLAHVMDQALSELPELNTVAASGAALTTASKDAVPGTSLSPSRALEAVGAMLARHRPT